MIWKMNNSCLDLFSVQNDTVTCIERPGRDHIFRLASTSEILWIDERFPRRPLLAYIHGRQFDRSLGLLTIDLPSEYYTFRLVWKVAQFSLAQLLPPY
jgi:hypothetical protein